MRRADSEMNDKPHRFSRSIPLGSLIRKICGLMLFRVKLGRYQGV